MRQAKPPMRQGTVGKSVRLLWAGLLLSVLSGCRSTLPIGHLLDDSYRYGGRVVRVEGEVVQAAGALGYGAYRITDGTGSLIVVSDGRGVPREGARVRVSGRFEPVLTVGRRSVAGLVERRRSRPRHY